MSNEQARPSESAEHEVAAPAVGGPEAAESENPEPEDAKPEGTKTDGADPDDAAPDAPAPQAATPALWLVVLAACAGQFLVVLDVSVVNVALPSLRSDLGMDAAGLQWVVNAYTLTFAGLLLLGGRAADIFGRKRIFLLGLALFTAASLLGGLAQQPWQLIAARAVQGTGAAVLAPATLTLLTTAVPPGRARTRAIATWAAVGAGGGAAGGLVGGVLTDAFSWRWVLLVNVPVGGLVLLTAALRVAEARHETAARRLDVPGALLVTAGLGALAWGIVRTEADGWTAPSVLWPLAAGAALLACFVAVEARTKEPLVPLRIFRRRAVAASSSAMFLCGGALFSMWYFVSLFMQNVLHYTPLEAGLGVIPQSAAIVLGAKTAPLLMARYGARAVALTGVAVAGCGCLWQSTMHAGGGTSTFLTDVAGPGVLMALGGGMTSTPLTSVAMADIATRDAGLVAGVFNTARTMGGSLGLAALSTVAAAHSGASADPDALASGYGLAFRCAAGVLALCAALVLLIRRDVPPAGAASAAGARPAKQRV